MDLDQLVGAAYGPYEYSVTADRVGAYVRATGDEVDRWVDHAPPSFAGALLFAAAPRFLGDPIVAPYTKRLVHADQSFAWDRPIVVGDVVSITGVFTKARERAGFVFASFDTVVDSQDGSVVRSQSTFLLGQGSSDDDPREEDEPDVRARGATTPVDAPGPVPGSAAGTTRSASRLDLVHYAAASGDFNPVHFDHDTAVAAGFPGVVVHGLLMGAWLMQCAAAYSAGPRPLDSARLRFRNPLRPGKTSSVVGSAEGRDGGGVELRLSLVADEKEMVAARISVAGE